MGSTIIRTALTKIVIYYAAFLILATALSFYSAGVSEIVRHGSVNNPFASILFKQDHWERFQYRRTAGQRGQSASILCFGDSNMFFPISNDGPDMALMLEEALDDGIDSPPPRVSKWDFAGANMFDYYCMFYWAVESPPDLIIIPINWRIFGERWRNLSQEWPYFHPELSALAPIFRKQSPGLVDPIKSRGITAIKQVQFKLSHYSGYFIGIRGWAKAALKALIDGSDDCEKALTENLGIPVGDETNKAAFNGKADRPAQAVNNPKNMMYHYSMAIGESNPALLTLEALARLISDHDTKVLFFVWPVDYEYFTEVGILDEEAFEHSMSLIANAAKGKNIDFVDLSGLLEHKYFCDRVGHYNAEGRREIARELAPIVRSILKERPGDINKQSPRQEE